MNAKIFAALIVMIFAMELNVEVASRWPNNSQVSNQFILSLVNRGAPNGGRTRGGGSRATPNFRQFNQNV
jgi:hypothetical protein